MRVAISSKSITNLGVTSLRGKCSFTPVGLPTVCFKMGFDGAGKPLFTKVGETAIASAGRVGAGIPTITYVALITFMFKRKSRKAMDAH